MSAVFNIILDFAGSLALLAILAQAFGHLHRFLVKPWLGQGVLGAVFGLVAAAEMHMPLEPMSGLIIDLRNAPIILCAAFLNWRATLICVSIAMTTRLNLGGIGAHSGVLGMAIAAGAGMVWAQLFPSERKRSTLQLFFLSVIGSSHLIGVVILPAPAFNWFVSNALLPIIVLNMLSITLVAMLMEAEQAEIAQRVRLEAAVTVDPDHGVMTTRALAREIELRAASGVAAPLAGVMRVEIRQSSRLRALLPSVWKNRLLGLAHSRIRQLLPPDALVAAKGQTTLIIPLDGDLFVQAEDLARQIERAVSETAFALPGGMSLPVSVRARWSDSAGHSGSNVATTVYTKAKQARAQNSGRAGANAPRNRRVQVAPATLETLFGTADHLMSQKNP